MSILKYFDSGKDLFGLAILVVGILAGVLLIQQSQEYREKAKKTGNNQTTICHLVSREDNMWLQMKVERVNLQKHIDHGDILGECPKAEPAVE